MNPFPGTSAVEEYIVRKLMRKLSKVNKPDFLGDIEVKEVDVGNTTPFFSKPMLKELTAEGDASMEVHVKYEGEFRIAISTVATLSMFTIQSMSTCIDADFASVSDLGQRFKSYSVKLVLAVILKDLEGNVLFKVKRPPSNRVWFGFTSPPKLGLRIEPVVSTRQIKWSLVTKPIESRLRELVSLVTSTRARKLKVSVGRRIYCSATYGRYRVLRHQAIRTERRYIWRVRKKGFRFAR